MNRLTSYILLALLALVLSIGQFFLTGIYGKIVFIPILIVFLTIYETNEALRTPS